MIRNVVSIAIDMAHLLSSSLDPTTFPYDVVRAERHIRRGFWSRHALARALKFI